jgi:cytoskeleton protein RodZ
VEIRDSSDRTIFSQLNLAGTTRRVSGVPPLSIVVGNAHGVKMTYGGKPVDLARHTKIDVARLTLE